MADHRQQDLLSKIEQIIDSDMSVMAKIILIKSLFLPAGWKWQLDWIMDTFELKNFSWRKVANELKEKGFLRYKHESKGRGDINRQLEISFHPVENQLHEKVHPVENQQDDESLNYQEVIHPVDFSSDDKSTDIYIYNNNTNIIPTGVTPPNPVTAINISVENQPDENRPNRPNQFLQVIPGNIPLALTKFNQWVYWKAVEKVKGEKPAKIPFMVDGKAAKVNDPSTWCNWRQIELNPPDKIGMTGIGFVLTGNDPYVMIDLDCCVIKGNPNEYALKVIEYFDSYTEISPSGSGIRIIIEGSLKKALKKPEIEIYSELRYMALTGQRCGEKFRGIEKRQNLLDKVIAKHAEPEKPKKKANPKLNGKFQLPKERIAEGNRNNRLAYWAGVIRNLSETEAEYYDYLHATNEKCCQPPLPESEVNAIGKSIWRYNA